MFKVIETFPLKKGIILFQKFENFTNIELLITNQF